MADSANKRRSARQLAGRKRASIYYEPDSDDDFGEDSDAEYGALPETRHRSKKQRRSKPQTRSAAHSRRQKGGPPRKSKPVTKKPGKLRPIGAPIKKREKKAAGFDGPTDGKIPDWTSLPIELLRDIFVFAAHPMHEQTPTAAANVGWLMRTARRLCRAFAVPALEAYYQSPYVHRELQAHHLLELMQMPADKTYINYNVKVKWLEIDVRRIAYSAYGKARIDLSQLVERLPQLQHFEIVHPVDSPPYRHEKIQPWRYPVDLFTALATSGARLKSWRWNRDMIPISSEDFNIYAYMSDVHRSKSFEYLERLVVCGFDANDSLGVPSSEVEPGPRKHRLAETVSLLSRLKDVTFISCDLIMEEFLEHLPKNLERLELSNCLEVTSEMLKTFLTTGGSQLRELVLNHDPALDLGFMPHLKTLCPKLQMLKMDFTYYSEHVNFNDAWAMYDHLLTEDEVPSWPSTLRHLELVNLQKWTAEAAQNLFRSLVDSSKDLPDLRHLVIQAHINIPWRDRTGFRDQWIVRLGRVYQRKSEYPFPYLGSFKQYRLWQESQAHEPVEVDGETAARRQLAHVRITPRKRDAESDVDIYDDESPSAPKQVRPQRRSARVQELRESHSASEAVEDAPTPTSVSSDSDDEDSKQPDDFIQGLCEVVDIRIDNQRPRESQFTEANFLDSEPSGDEDWHEGAEMEDDGYAW